MFVDGFVSDYYRYFRRVGVLLDIEQSISSSRMNLQTGNRRNIEVGWRR
jgi:hypothetical protein